MNGEARIKRTLYSKYHISVRLVRLVCYVRLVRHKNTPILVESVLSV